MERISEALKDLQLDKKSRIEQARSGLFQSKEELIKTIQDEIRQKTEAILAEEIAIESEIANLKAPIPLPNEAITIGQKIQQINSLIERQVAKKETIHQNANIRLESLEFNKKIAQRSAKINQLKQAQQATDAENLARHNLELKTIKENLHLK